MREFWKGLKKDALEGWKRFTMVDFSEKDCVFLSVYKAWKGECVYIWCVYAEGGVCVWKHLSYCESAAGLKG